MPHWPAHLGRRAKMESCRMLNRAHDAKSCAGGGFICYIDSPGVHGVMVNAWEI